VVYKEIHTEEKQAKVDDYWMKNVFGLTAVHPVISTSRILDKRKIGKPEGICENPACHPSSQKLSVVTEDYNLDMCNMCNFCKKHNCSGYCLHRQEIR
jgi:hypothetical protein